jgi:glutamyl/glutaminyl-tRNA synthetase
MKMDFPTSEKQLTNKQQLPAVGRLAPTPSGYLHLGNAVNFVLTWLLVRQAGGTLHLRVDDLDRARLRRPYLENIFRVIDWLKIDYDVGPNGPDDFLRHYSQLLYLPEYNRVLRRLVQQPGLVYATRRSRTSPAEPVPLGTPGAAWRVRMPPTVRVAVSEAPRVSQVPLAELMPDFVVRKKDGVAAYQVASVVDDLRLGTTLVVRGLDLQPSTAAQLWLAEQISDTQAFTTERIQFYHHALLTDATGHKLSKSTQASGDAGVLALGSPAAVYRSVVQVLGLPVEAGESLVTLQTAIKKGVLPR